MSDAHLLPPDLVDGLDVHDATPLSGGDISAAYRLDTADGRLFLKTHDSPTPGLFERESAGLRALAAHTPEPVRVPEVVRESPHGLVLEWIDLGGRRDRATEADFGRALAGLHRTTHDTFGGLDGVTFGYLGSAEVDLTPSTDWVEFYVDRRVGPLLDRAVREGAIDPGAADLFDRVRPRAAELCGPDEPPALLHGDLWAGNRVVDADGVNWLIDPAAHWGHREVDLAMMQLFGGFGDACLSAYGEAYPLADGWSDRVPWYQLVPLLVHAILFGGHYGAAATRVLARYA
ncbi:fructosamine kinase family protein [Agilicoccus flavus]|uniref:fructosamine kinase family protein n=1 Tax=Agilicoccus flavus TaxID=2775968 RepID=UPI001CF6B232|nr:fructosamine kinase family protein [Agilicoccus flavus]